MGGRVGVLFLRGGPHNKLSGMDSEIVLESRFISVSRRTGIREGDDKGVVLGRCREDTRRGSRGGELLRSKNCFNYRLINTRSLVSVHITLDRI